jgi:hypothetical protein
MRYGGEASFGSEQGCLLLQLDQRCNDLCEFTKAATFAFAHCTTGKYTTFDLDVLGLELDVNMLSCGLELI